jgi:hypothetical protein
MKPTRPWSAHTTFSASEYDAAKRRVQRLHESSQAETTTSGEGKAQGQPESFIENVQRSISAIRSSIISRIEAYPSLKATLDSVRAPQKISRSELKLP